MSERIVSNVTDVRVLPVLPETTLRAWRGVEVRAGGWGSDLSRDPLSAEHLYLLADRGPNFEAPGEDTKGFALPGFVPRIGRFRICENALELERVVEIRSRHGSFARGLPVPPGPGSTGERAVDLVGEPLATDERGLDPEGLVALADGGFWLAEEYGPSLIRVGADGVEQRRHAPHSGAPRLPAVLAKRRPNRGFEGIAMLSDGRTLCAVLQSSLDNPDASVRASGRWVRVMLFDTVAGVTRQYLYEQDAPVNSLSAVAALPDGDLLVMEHDALMPGAAGKPAWCKRVYRVSLGGASDVSGDSCDPDGLMLDGSALEAHTRAGLERHGIVPVSKRLVLDLLAIGYPHDKPEGLAVIGSRTLGVLNDDDFGITGDGTGSISEKRLSLTSERDHCALWLVTLDAPI